MTWNEHHARTLSRVFSALNDSGIDWLVLKNFEGLPDKNSSKDVDLGVCKRHFNKAQKIIFSRLQEVGFEHVLVERFRYASCFTLFGYANDRIISIKIDIVDRFVFRGASIISAEELVQANSYIDSIPVSSRADESFMLWIQTLLLSRKPKKKYFSRIRNGALADPEGFRSRLHRAFGKRIGDRVWRLIDEGNLDGTADIVGQLRRAGWRQSFIRRPMRTLEDTVHYYATYIGRKIHRNPGTFLAILGPDGVGKTTFIEILASKLAELQVKDRDAILVEHFRPHILPNIRTLLTGQEEKLEAFHNPHRAHPASLPSSILRLCYYWADYAFGYWCVIRRRCVAWRTVIFDRYFYDFIVDPRRSRLSLPAWLPRAFLAITPKPDLVFFLDCDPDMIFARKQELSRDEIARQLDAYRELAASDPDRFVRLDASQDPDRIVEEALRQLVMRSYDRIDSA